MWQGLLRAQYASREDFINWSDTYGLAERLGYDSSVEAWDANPFVRGSSNPADYGKVDTSKFTDGEVIGIDRDDNLIMWDADTQRPYNCGESVEDYGINNLTEVERMRLDLVSYL